MATQIDKQDTKDLSESIANQIYDYIVEIDSMPSRETLIVIIQEELSNWISDMESEDADQRNNMQGINE